MERRVKTWCGTEVRGFTWLETNEMEIGLFTQVSAAFTPNPVLQPEPAGPCAAERASPIEYNWTPSVTACRVVSCVHACTDCSRQKVESG